MLDVRDPALKLARIVYSTSSSLAREKVSASGLSANGAVNRRVRMGRRIHLLVEVVSARILVILREKRQSTTLLY